MPVSIRSATSIMLFWVLSSFLGAQGTSSKIGTVDAASIGTFEVATIKRSRSVERTPIIRPTRSGVSASNASVLELVRYAYHLNEVKDNVVSGLPDWANVARFDIEAKVGETVFESLRSLTRDERDRKLQLMLQGLLKDRFSLATHEESREIPIFLLVVSKSGAKLAPPTNNSEFPTGTIRLSQGQMVGKGVSTHRLAESLAREVDRPIFDGTGLVGKYDFTLTWKPDLADSSMSSHPESDMPEKATDVPGTSLFTAVTEQLGLRLQPSKGQGRAVVIDHIAFPTDN